MQIWNLTQPAAASPSMWARGQLIILRNDFELEGRPHVDIFQQERYLVPGVSMQLKVPTHHRGIPPDVQSHNKCGGAPQGHFTTVV